jgi:hypothetical protein
MMNCDPSSHTVKRGILTINMKTSEQIKQVSLKVLKRNNSKQNNRGLIGNIIKIVSYDL